MKIPRLNKLLAVSGCLLCLLTLALAGFARAADPRQCPADIAAAIDAGDAGAFERLVDIDTILNEALGIFLAEARKPESAARLPPLLGVMFSQAAADGVAGDNIRNLLFTEARAFILNGVSSGAFAGRKPAGAALQGNLAPLFADASTGRKEIRNIGQATPVGREWRVPFVVRDGGNGQEYPVVSRVGVAGDGLRLTHVENLQALIARVWAESLAVSE